jgi:hypothetical protein
MDGLTVLKELRSIPEAKDCGVVVLTGQPLESDELECGKLGADDYMTKPFEPETLLSTVLRISARRRGTVGSDDPTPEPHNDGEAVTALEARVAEGSPLALVHARLENLDGLEASYGIKIAEMVIGFTNKVMRNAAGHCGEPPPIVEHGDDGTSLILLHPDQLDRFCKMAVRDYDRAMITAFYGAEHVDAGRDSVAVPPASLSMGVVTNVHRHFESAGQAVAIAAEMAGYAGRSQRSNYEVDRRH